MDEDAADLLRGQLRIDRDRDRLNGGRREKSDRPMRAVAQKKRHSLPGPDTGPNQFLAERADLTVELRIRQAFIGVLFLEFYADLIGILAAGCFEDLKNIHAGF